MAKIQKKCICPSQENMRFIQGPQKQSQNKKFSNGPQGTTRKLYKKKSRGKRSRMVLYRCRVAQSGGNWLKMAKTEILGTKNLSKNQKCTGLIK